MERHTDAISQYNTAVCHLLLHLQVLEGLASLNLPEEAI